ncbi:MULTISPECIES: glycosyl hydrolase 53 family protein [Methylobacterium]|uniref:glycosyl hydrolase 53 family protein n=1 Tax=Methylobacterium TaxID=407 RepID=UPI0013ED7185|nr:glycosyl hydrolase 53 family protein [Methylobacterium sp. DB0501]NGM34270.1 hypothetical protein [Methylobacterium sp. DB0501]
MRDRDRWCRPAGAWRALLVAGLLLASPAVQAGSGIVGVNVTNPQWLDRATQDAVIQQLVRSGVTTIRIPLLPPSQGANHEPSIDLIKRFSAAGLRITLNLYPVFRADLPPRPAHPKPHGLWAAHGYSAIDLPETRAFTQSVLQELDRQAIKLAAIEVANEINWTQFNGDFQVPGRGRIISLDELQHDARVRDIARGFQAYIGALREIKAVRALLTVNRTTPIISAGLSDPGTVGPNTGSDLDVVSPVATIQYLKSLGLDDLVDGYGIHTYDIAGVESADHADRLVRRTFSFCGGEGGKPCWLTEWGVDTQTATCPPDDRRRVAIVNNWRTFMRELHRTGKLQASFYYTWSVPNDKISLFQCDQLTKSGAIAIAPDVLN